VNDAFTPMSSEWAMAVDAATGIATSAPVIAAMVSVLRTYFNSIPFAMRARRSTRPWMWAAFLCSGAIGASGRAVSFRHDSRGMIRPAGLLPDGCEAVGAVRSPAHTWVRGFDSDVALTGLIATIRDQIPLVICDRARISVQ
jgi:hypothetical protein